MSKRRERVVLAAVAGIVAGLGACAAREEAAPVVQVPMTSARPPVVVPVATGAVAPPAPLPTADPPVDKASCKGRNDCKGKGSCKTEQHACKGLNDCKGQGGCAGP